MVHLRQVLNPLRVPRFPKGHAHNTFPRCQADSGGFFCTPPRAVPRKDEEVGSSAAPSGEKPGDFDPNRAAFGKKLPTLRRERPTGERARRLAISTPPLDVTANDESDKLNCADNELDYLDLSHLPTLCNLNRSLNRPHTLNLRRVDGRREQQHSHWLSVVLHFRRHIAR